MVFPQKSIKSSWYRPSCANDPAIYYWLQCLHLRTHSSVFLDSGSHSALLHSSGKTLSANCDTASFAGMTNLTYLIAGVIVSVATSKPGPGSTIEVSKNLSFCDDVGNNFKLLSNLCHVVCPTEASTQPRVVKGHASNAIVDG